MNETFEVKMGFNGHCHLRTGNMLKSVIGYIARWARYVVAMGNTPQPIADGPDVERYRKEILSARPSGRPLEPVMVVMLTMNTGLDMIDRAVDAGAKVLKLIPKGVSTNSETSVALQDLPRYYFLIERAFARGMILSLHAELLEFEGKELRFLDREKAAVSHVDDLARAFPGRKIVAEHISTTDLGRYVLEAPDNVAGGLTLHHAISNYATVCNPQGEVINPHNYCMPVLKPLEHMLFVRKLMTSGNPKFFFAPDFAPHPEAAKLETPPKSGIADFFDFLRLRQMFEVWGEVDKFENFVSNFGPRFYGFPPITEKIKLVRRCWCAPGKIGDVVPFMVHEPLQIDFAD